MGSPTPRSSGFNNPEVLYRGFINPRACAFTIGQLRGFGNPRQSGSGLVNPEQRFLNSYHSSNLQGEAP